MAFDDLRVDQLQQMLARVLMVDVDHHQAARFADLGRGQPDAGRRVHGLNHGFDQRVDAAVNVTYFPGRLLEDGIGIGVYSKQRHRQYFYRRAAFSPSWLQFEDTGRILAPELKVSRPMSRPEVSDPSLRGREKPMLTRCDWAKSALMTRYHDEEWGAPVHDDRVLFEFLCLEGAQAGLSWETVLKKRDNYRAAFDNFEPAAVSTFNQRKLDRLLGDPGLIRNRLKMASAVGNAKALLKVREEFGSFDAYIWRFVNGKPVVNAWQALKQIPAHTAASDAMSKDLRKRGFNFVGTTICYAFMQAVGMVNDHLVDCFRYRELRATRGGRGAPGRA
jgi:DNA-3-methyladenine glycosylase I